MAEWMDVMNQFNRMCWSYQRERKCPMACPMNGVNISQCRKIAFERSKETEEIVMQWAAEHPVVYPTWYEWLQEMGVMTDIHDRLNNYKQVMEVCGKPLYSIPNAKVLCPIPADIAEKLGIEPKEG